MREPLPQLRLPGRRRGLGVEGVAAGDLGEPDGEAERAELIKHGADVGDVRPPEVGLQAAALEGDACVGELPEARAGGVGGVAEVVADRDDVEVVEEERGERVGTLGGAEEVGGGIAAEPGLVEVEVEHLVAHVPVHEVALVAGEEALDAAGHGGAELVGGGEVLDPPRGVLRVLPEDVVATRHRIARLHEQQ